MSLWTSAVDGLWTTPGNWSGGVPNQNGAIADFVITANTGALITSFTENATVSVGTLNVTISGTRDLLFHGSLADSGSGVATLSFAAGANTDLPAMVTINTVVGGGEFQISAFGGLRVQIGSETHFNVVTAGTIARIDAPLIGANAIHKLGAGTLRLGSDNSGYSGVISVDGGTLQVLAGNSLGTNLVLIKNDATLLAVGTVTASVGTISGQSGIAGSAHIAATSGGTLTIADGFSHKSSGLLTLGSATNNGTIVIGATDVFASQGSIRIDSTTIKLASSQAAVGLFHNLLATDFVELVGGAVIDTGGFTTSIHNLDLDAGTIRSSSGALNVNLFDKADSALTQSGIFEGTANADRLNIDVLNSFSLAATTFLNWSASDVIQIDGSANANTLTGSQLRDTINGLGGNDTLIGNGGADLINGGDGDDLIVINASSGNANINGDLGTDTLRLTGGTVSLNGLSGIEAIELQNGATLALTNSQFVGLPGNAAISGTGTITVSLLAGQSALTNAFVIAPGSNITFNITGASGAETITIHPDAIGIVNGGSGNDTITGGNLGDTITSGGGVDAVNTGAGNDLVIMGSSSNGSFLNGGANIDTLRIASGSVSLGSVAGFEAIEMTAGTTLNLTHGQFASGFASNSALSGSGTINLTIDSTIGVNYVLAKALVVAGGSAITFNIAGNTGTDVIKAANGVTNVITTGGGTNTVQGGNLGDTITGGGGVDKIAGNGGVDVMTGGTGADVFKFRAMSDSGVGNQADVITDFLSGTDKLNFGRIDADPLTAGDQAFQFMGTGAFAGNGAASIRYSDIGADLRVDIDFDGDFFADMQIILQGAGAQVLTAADFVL